ncbi:MAG: hypothetical protein ABL857_03675 [Rickettsiales bacterium]|jgi:hypothetical protein
MVVNKNNVDDTVDVAKAAHRHVSSKLKGKGTALGVVEDNGTVRQVSGEASDKITGAVNSAANMAMQGAMFAPILVPAGATAAEWAGKKTGLKGVEAVGIKAKNFTEKPFAKVFENFPFAKKIAAGTQKVADFFGKVSSKTSDITGINRVIPKIHEKRIGAHTAKLAEFFKTANAHHGNLPESLQKHATEILESSKNLGNVNAEKLEAAKSLFTNEAANLGKLTPSAKAAVNHFNKIGKIADKVAGGQASIAGWKSSKNVLSELPKVIGKTPVLQAGMNVAFIGTSAMAMFGVATNFKQNIASLKEIYHDVTGKKVSTIAILTGDVPALVAEERSKMMKKFAISEATGAASLGLMVMSALRGKVGMGAFLAPMAVDMGVGALMDEPVSPYYASMKKAHATGQKIPVEAYTELVGKVSPALKKRGAETSKFAQALGEQYAKEQTPLATVLNEADVMNRINGIIAANEAAKPVAAAVGATTNKTTSHVAALQKQVEQPALPVRNHPVAVGGYTQQLVDNAKNAKNALTPSSV